MTHSYGLAFARDVHMLGDPCALSSLVRRLHPSVRGTALANGMERCRLALDCHEGVAHASHNARSSPSRSSTSRVAHASAKRRSSVATCVSRKVRPKSAGVRVVGMPAAAFASTNAAAAEPAAATTSLRLPMLEPNDHPLCIGECLRPTARASAPCMRAVVGCRVGECVGPKSAFGWRVGKSWACAASVRRGSGSPLCSPVDHHLRGGTATGTCEPSRLHHEGPWLREGYAGRGQCAWWPRTE